MKVLSVRQPWAWMLVRDFAGKHIENRDWTTRYRGLVLIHAGRTFEEDALDWIWGNLTSEQRTALPQKKSSYPRGGIVGIARLADVVTVSHDTWFVGAYGWVFDKARPLPLIPMRGHLGLVDAPADIVAQVKAACARERGAA